MTIVATQILAMGIDTPILLWIGGILLSIGLFFALVGRRPARRRHASGADADAAITDDNSPEPTANP